MRLALAALPLMLAACAALQPAPRAADAGISGDVLRVSFTDGSVCRATLAPEGGAGDFADCAVPASYDVRILRPNPLAPVLRDLVEPFAEIAVTAGGATTRFRTPASANPGFDAGSID